MASQTTNLNLTKPAYSDTADIAVINSNMDILDTVVGNLAKTISSGSMHSIMTSGLYYLANAVTDKPTSTGGYYSAVSNGTVVSGVFVQNSTGNAYIVSYNGTTWATQQIALDANKVSNSMYGIVTVDGKAPSAISAGQYMMHQGYLRKATTYIASGETITSSNSVVINNGGMNSLNADIDTLSEQTANIDTAKYREMFGSGTVNNCNDGEIGRFYFVYGSTTNAPKQGILYTYGKDNTKYQIFIAENTVYTRGYINSAWTAWQQLAMKDELGGTKFLTFNVNNSSVTIDISNGFRGILFSSSAYSSEEGIYSVRTSSAGGVSIGTFFASSGLIFNTGVNNKLTISSTRYVEFTLIIMNGTASK